MEKLCVKIPFVEGSSFDAPAILEEMNAWIQKDVLPGTLVDVADYTHMVDGPGIVLVAYEYMVSVDHQDGVSGLRVAWRLGGGESLLSRLSEVFKVLSIAASRFEEKLGLSLNLSALEASCLDRLHPFDGEALRSALEEKLGTSATVKGEREARRLPGIEVALAQPLELSALC